MERLCMDIKDGWKFYLDPQNKGLDKQWYKKGLEDGYGVVLPHTFSVDRVSDEDKSIGWYEYHFTVKEEWIGQRIYFDFHGIYRDTDFWINGESCGRHYHAGFTSFHLDVSDCVKAGENCLMVRVDNHYSPEALPWDIQFDWADDGGIFRPAYLNICDKNGISALCLRSELDLAIGKRVHRAPASLLVEADRYGDAKNGSYRYELYEGTPEAKGELISSGIWSEGEQIALENVQLWHFDAPYLYTFRLYLMENETQLDCVETAFGFRSFTTKGREFIFNGESIEPVGTEWMPGSDPRIGNAETKEDIARWLTLLRASNCIFTRVHWQQDASFFDWCDRHGMLVQEEIPLWGYPKEPVSHETVLSKAQADEMLFSHYNHPSIISWGVGNELDGQSAITKAYVESTTSYIKEKDPSRLTCYVSNTLWQTPDDATAVGDMMFGNEYMGTWHGDLKPEVEIPRFRQGNPDKPLVISEFGLCEPAWPGGDPRRTQIFLDKIAVYRKTGVSGFIYFCLNDYRTQIGEEGRGIYRRRVHGSTDLYGNPKPSYEVVKRECSPLYIEKQNKTEEGIELVITNRDALPRYQTEGYALEVRDRAGNLAGFYPIAAQKPGEKQTLVVDDKANKATVLRIVRPDMTEAISYTL